MHMFAARLCFLFDKPSCMQMLQAAEQGTLVAATQARLLAGQEGSEGAIADVQAEIKGLMQGMQANCLSAQFTSLAAEQGSAAAALQLGAPQDPLR